jgi:hypothetical protein
MKDLCRLREAENGVIKSKYLLGKVVLTSPDHKIIVVKCKGEKL